MAVAHTRYGTMGGGGRNNCQPIEVSHRKAGWLWLIAAISAMPPN